MQCHVLHIIYSSSSCLPLTVTSGTTSCERLHSLLIFLPLISLVRQEDAKRAEKSFFINHHFIIWFYNLLFWEKKSESCIWHDSSSGRTDVPISVLSSFSLPWRRFRSHDFQVDYSLKSRQADYFLCKDEKICRLDSSFNSRQRYFLTTKMHWEDSVVRKTMFTLCCCQHCFSIQFPWVIHKE